MSQPPSDVPPLILPPPLPAAKEDDYADSGIRAIDLSERPVAESLREIMASSPRVPREVPPPLPPVTSVHHNRHWTLALLGLVYLFSAFLIAGEGVWCLVSHDSAAAPMDWAESVRLWLENPVWVAWGLTLGLGLILARRWARRLVMAEAISFLVSSLVVALALAADAWPNVTTHVAADDDTAVWYYLVALGGVAVLAGLLFAKTGAVQRLGVLFLAIFGNGLIGTLLAATVLCSFFTAFTGGSGVTILALGGLLLPLLRNAGYPEQRGISLVTSASALGVLLAPSVPLIMYAIIARVPINTMFLAGLVPALVMIICLLVFGGYLRATRHGPPPVAQTVDVRRAIWNAKWEILAPVVAIASLVSGLATPTESAALTAAYAILTLGWAHRELSWRSLGECLSQCAQIIGGVMLILGMALGLTNYLVDAGIPDLVIDAVQGLTQNKYLFLLALNVFLFVAGALMEIYAAIVVLVPLLLPLAMSYGIDPVHFGIIFLANMEMGFLCPPAGMNIFFASAIFKKPIRTVAKSVLPALLAIFIGTMVISWLPLVALGLPTYLGSMP